ncbi:MAG TPA: hypothetical protein VMB85_20020 [Bryobacteraceae bacterium]|nr:hypothetical protein [Bryobacteraceae bacterium]
MTAHAILLANLSAALFLTGLSWFLQIVEYPLLAHLDTPDFPKFAALHRRRNTLLMAGPMTVEMITAAWMLVRPELPHRDVFRAFLLLIVIWLITFSRHFPLHRRLLHGYNREILRSLEKWNWLRTLCWTARAGLLIFIARFC